MEDVRGNRAEKSRGTQHPTPATPKNEPSDAPKFPTTRTDSLENLHARFFFWRFANPRFSPPPNAPPSRRHFSLVVAPSSFKTGCRTILLVLSTPRGRKTFDRRRRSGRASEVDAAQRPARRGVDSCVRSSVSIARRDRSRALASIRDRGPRSGRASPTRVREKSARAHSRGSRDASRGPGGG